MNYTEIFKQSPTTFLLDDPAIRLNYHIEITSEGIFIDGALMSWKDIDEGREFIDKINNMGGNSDSNLRL